MVCPLAAPEVAQQKTSFWRAALERLGRNYVFKAKLPARYGSRPIYLSSGNHLAVLKPGEAKFDKHLLNFVDRFVEPGKPAWDIGANMGLFCIPAAHKAQGGQILAFEPDPFNVLLLRRTLSLAENAKLNVEVLPAALSDTVGVAQLLIPVRGRSANSLAGGAHGTQMGGVRDRFAVVTVTADWALERYPAPAFVKCDAEGAEEWILRGATRLLREARPVMIMEMPQENAAACKAILDANDYACFSAYAPVDPKAELAQIDSSWDTLLIPREKVASFAGR